MERPVAEAEVIGADRVSAGDRRAQFYSRLCASFATYPEVAGALWIYPLQLL